MLFWILVNTRAKINCQIILCCWCAIRRKLPAKCVHFREINKSKDGTFNETSDERIILYAYIYEKLSNCIGANGMRNALGIFHLHAAQVFWMGLCVHTQRRAHKFFAHLVVLCTVWWHFCEIVAVGAVAVVAICCLFFADGIIAC